jgi:hypothetical protein
VFLPGVAANWLPEVVRGMCGDPAAIVPTARPATVDAVLRGIARAGRRPVLLAGWPGRLSAYGGQPRLIMRLRTYMDPSNLTTPPLTNWPLKLSIWMSEPAP